MNDESVWLLPKVHFACLFGWSLVVQIFSAAKDSPCILRLLYLPVSTRKKVAPSGTSLLSHLLIYHDVYDVLLLKQVGNGVYGRIGVGRIMDRLIMKAFDAADTQELTLA